MTFTLKPLADGDEPFLWEMLYQAIYVPEGQPPPARSILQEPALAKYVEGWGRQPGDLGIMALEDETTAPAGAAWLRLFSASNPGYGFVDERTPELSIAVLPEYRGQGLGTRLLEALTLAARGHYRAVSLSVSRGNPAERLYRRAGFEVAAEGELSITMVKELG